MSISNRQILLYIEIRFGFACLLLSVICLLGSHLSNAAFFSEFLGAKVSGPREIHHWKPSTTISETDRNRHLLVMSADNPQPIREDGESGIDFMSRVQAYQASINSRHEPAPTTLPSKVCGSCNRTNGAATKKCPCGNNLGLSQTPSAILSRATRAKNRQKAKDASHNQCNLCQGSLSKGSKDLGISLCLKSTHLGNGSVSRRVEPCGRAMHLKCLQKQVNKSNQRQGDLGILPNKCAHCNCLTKYPHFIQIPTPRE